jgi:hypothetical protein
LGILNIYSSREEMLDKDLRPEHIQSISNASEVVGFFSYLGYNTSERITQFPSNLGITNETLLKEIKKIELIANQENLLQVYLFELSSVTIANTQALVRVFRNRVGNYLLVLTSDYNRIDFVLIERVLPDDKTEGIVTKQASIRPRILTVDRLKPTRIDQRVLRRFSYTEADPIAQYEKLQAAYIVADWSEEFFNNRALFSDYYLIERLRDEPEWRESVKPSYSRFRELYRDTKSVWPGKPEREFRKGFLEPVFEALGFMYKECKSAIDDSREPDYELYENPSQSPFAKGGRPINNDQKNSSTLAKETTNESPPLKKGGKGQYCSACKLFAKSDRATMHSKTSKRQLMRLLFL